METIKVTYEVEDGYVGGKRPQQVIVSRDEIRDCKTTDEAMKLVDAAIQEHFEQNISWDYDRTVLLEEVQDILAGNS